jgi:hypothetical protein
MATFFKAVRPDGASFNDASFVWDVTPGGVTTHPLRGKDRRGLASDDAAGYLSVATVATDCTGMQWPCRLLEVESVGRLWTPNADHLPNKRAALRFRTVRELVATDVFGPQGVQVAALIERAGLLTRDDMTRLYAARDAAWYAARDVAWDVAWDAARDAAWYAARDVAWDVAWDAARYTALALVTRNLLDSEHYDTLTMPWRTTIGRIHPDDADV